MSWRTPSLLVSGAALVPKSCGNPTVAVDTEPGPDEERSHSNPSGVGSDNQGGPLRNQRARPPEPGKRFRSLELRRF